MRDYAYNACLTGVSSNALRLRLIANGQPVADVQAVVFNLEGDTFPTLPSMARTLTGGFEMPEEIAGAAATQLHSFLSRKPSVHSIGAISPAPVTRFLELDRHGARPHMQSNPLIKS